MGINQPGQTETRSSRFFRRKSAIYLTIRPEAPALARRVRTGQYVTGRCMGGSPINGDGIAADWRASPRCSPLARGSGSAERAAEGDFGGAEVDDEHRVRGREGLLVRSALEHVGLVDCLRRAR
jgi:hypothetical protein